MNYFYTMELHYCSGLLFVLRSLNSYSQIDIIGRVEDELDGRPLPSASVYFNNTTIGTNTDLQGAFHFKDNFSIKIDQPLLVQYGKAPSAKNYLSQKGWTEGFLTKGVESYIRFNKSPIGISYAGVLSNATGIEFEGYWQYEKLANRLPYNYWPD